MIAYKLMTIPGVQKPHCDPLPQSELDLHLIVSFTLVAGHYRTSPRDVRVERHTAFLQFSLVTDADDLLCPALQW